MSDFVVARNCYLNKVYISRMLPGEAELVSE